MSECGETRILAIGADVHRAILLEIRRRNQAKVISTNAVVDTVKAQLPECDLSEGQLVKLVTETAACLGVIPVYDPSALRHSTG